MASSRPATRQFATSGMAWWRMGWLRTTVERLRILKRLALIESDLDADLDDSLAKGLHDEHLVLKARVGEWLPMASHDLYVDNIR